ncbi:MAG: hypothetical protein F4Z50_01470 [Gemmatimonadetes bacterium]|nr:hypothetical protein [Gemmatimonadota bacterium]
MKRRPQLLDSASCQPHGPGRGDASKFIKYSGSRFVDVLAQGGEAADPVIGGPGGRRLIQIPHREFGGTAGFMNQLLQSARLNRGATRPSAAQLPIRPSDQFLDVAGIAEPVDLVAQFGLGLCTCPDAGHQVSDRSAPLEPPFPNCCCRRIQHRPSGGITQPFGQLCLTPFAGNAQFLIRSERVQVRRINSRTLQLLRVRGNPSCQIHDRGNSLARRKTGQNRKRPGIGREDGRPQRCRERSCDVKYCFLFVAVRTENREVLKEFSEAGGDHAIGKTQPIGEECRLKKDAASR